MANTLRAALQADQKLKNGKSPAEGNSTSDGSNRMHMPFGISSKITLDPTVQKLLPLIEASQMSEKSTKELIDVLKHLDPAQLLPLLDVLEFLQQKGLLNREFMSTLLNSKLEQIERQFFTTNGSSCASSPTDTDTPPFMSRVQSSQLTLSSVLTSLNENNVNLPDLRPSLQGEKLKVEMNIGCNGTTPLAHTQNFSSPSSFIPTNKEKELRVAMGFDPTVDKKSDIHVKTEFLRSYSLDTPGMMLCQIPQDILSLQPTSQSSRSGSPSSVITDEDRDVMVTSSGRNRGLGRANEPKFFCQVCGDIAAGFHCGAYVCEACKKFYLRCLKNKQNLGFSCPKTQDCQITKDTRSHCQFCRYQKCAKLGMYKPGRDDSKHLRVDFRSIPCKVCGASSSGFHFGAITCEGCKGFFRRMIKEQLHKKFACSNGGTCEVASDKRTSCKACRFHKCVQVGMALEGTRLGRQSNSMKRSTLIQYKDSHGMDVALFPKQSSGDESDLVQHKVRRLLAHPTGQPNIPHNIKAEKLDDPLETLAVCDIKDSGYHMDHHWGFTALSPASSMPSFTSTLWAPPSQHQAPGHLTVMTSASNFRLPPTPTMATPPFSPAASSHVGQPTQRSRTPSLGSQPSPMSLSSPQSDVTSPYIDQLAAVQNKMALRHQPHRRQLVQSFLQKISQHNAEPAKKLEANVIRHRHSSAASVSSDVGWASGPAITDSVERIRVMKQVDELFAQKDKIVCQVMKAYRELSNIQTKLREPISRDPQVPKTEKMDAWFAAYESFMHLTKYTLKFVKKIPGFRELNMEDQITLVRESTYAINLLYHSQFRSVYTTEKRWYSNTAVEKIIIMRHFPKFQLLQTHLEYVGEIFMHLNPTVEEYAFLCAIVLFTIDSFLIKDYQLVTKIQEFLTDAFLEYCSEQETDVNRPGMLLLRLAELKRANFEHTQIALDIQNENPDVEFSQLWCEMFLSCCSCSSTA